MQPAVEPDLHRFSELHGKGVVLNECGRLASRCKDFNSCVLFSATPLYQDEMFEVSIITLWKHMAGTLSLGVTTSAPSVCNGIPSDSFYLTGKYIFLILSFLMVCFFFKEMNCVIRTR